LNPYRLAGTEQSDDELRMKRFSPPRRPLSAHSAGMNSCPIGTVFLGGEEGK
jgi:hypothetical protein